MSAILDQILERMNRLAATRAGVLFAARYEIKFQKGCGIGRPRFRESVLLVRPVESPTWRLPESIREVAPSHCFFDQAEEFGDALLVRCVEFRPALDESKYDHCWTNAEFALHCTSNHPSASAAITQFTSANSAAPSLQQETTKMDSNTRAEFSAAQVLASFTYQAFGDSAPPPLQGEGLIDYRTRLARKYQQYSKTCKDVKLESVGCPVALGYLEGQIYADAVAALHSGGTAPPGQLVAITKPDASGRPVTRYVGDDGACWNRFNAIPRYVLRFRQRGESW